MPLNQRISVLAAKVESVVGTAESLSGTEGAFNVYFEGWTPNIQITPRPKQGGHDHNAASSGSRWGQVSFAVDLVGNGSAGLPSWASTFLVACGMTLSTATYSFGNTSSTLTIGWYRNGKKYALAGCTGTYRIELTAGNVGRVHFTFIGKIVDDADVAILAPTFPTTVPPEWANASGLTFDSTSPKVSRLTFDAGVETVMREDPADPTGYVASWIVDRAATATMDPEDVLVGDYDWLTKIKNSTEASLVAVVGTAANNTITITAAKAQPVSATPSDRNKIATLDVTLNLNTAFTILFG